MESGDNKFIRYYSMGNSHFNVQEFQVQAALEKHRHVCVSVYVSVCVFDVWREVQEKIPLRVTTCFQLAKISSSYFQSQCSHQVG